MATTTPPAPAPAPPANRFFDWMRAINVPRRPGWIGGVCAGVADRLGIDPIIVRGIAVVIAVLGGPAFLLYAAAWLLLPDTEARIHLERLIRGDLDRAIVGIGALVVFSLLPFAQGFWFLGSAYWGQWYWPDSAGRVLWTVLLLAAAVVATVWVARRASRSEEPIVVPATTDARPETVPEPPRASGAAAFVGDPSMGSGTADTVAEPAEAPLLSEGASAPVPPPAPAPDAPPEDLAAWREQQSRWKTEHAAWKQQQAASARELRNQRAAETHARAVERSAEYDVRRRLRRLANPRVTGSHVAITLGAALLIGGVAALLSQSGDSWSGYGVAVGLAAATITVGLSAIVAGIARRRSGFLGFVALLLAVSTVLVSFVPPDRTLVGVADSAVLENGGRYAQLVGTFTAFSPNDSALPATSTLDLWQGTGNIDIHTPKGTTVRIEANLRKPNLWQYHFKKNEDGDWDAVTVKTPYTRTADGRYSYSFTVGLGTPTKTVRIWQGSGSVSVSQDPPPEALNPLEPSASPGSSSDPTATDPASPETGVKP
jgi:phage shock protein PspC (stress-responsive transcriptional regulator)